MQTGLLEVPSNNVDNVYGLQILAVETGMQWYIELQNIILRFVASSATISVFTYCSLLFER